MSKNKKQYSIYFFLFYYFYLSLSIITFIPIFLFRKGFFIRFLLSLINHFYIYLDYNYIFLIIEKKYNYYLFKEFENIE